MAYFFHTDPHCMAYFCVIVFCKQGGWGCSELLSIAGQCASVRNLLNLSGQCETSVTSLGSMLRRVKAAERLDVKHVRFSLNQ